jgi:hypothetical protein
MKRTAVVVFIFSIIFSFAFITGIFSEDDPLAGMDTGAPQQVTTDNSGVPGDEAGVPQVPDNAQAGAPADAAADQMAGMDAGVPAGGSADIAASADVLFPDNAPGTDAIPGADSGTVTAPGEPGGALPGETGAAMPGEGAGGPELPGMGGETPAGNAQQQIMPVQQLAPVTKEGGIKSRAAVKSGPSTHKGNTKTDDIYTKSSFIGGFRNLREIMDWGIKTTSKLSPENNASKLGDNIVDTAWVEAKKDGGKKQAITFSFDEKYFIGLYEKKYHKVKITKIMILNGFASDKATWKKYYRVRKLKITKNNKLQFYIMLHDTMNWQTITMKKPLIIKPGDKLKAEIMDAYPEVRRDNDTYVALTEFTFLGEPYGPKVEPKYIQDNLQGME